MSTGTHELEALRRELDTIDHRLLATVRDRVALCVEVARLKDHHGIPMMQPARVDLVLDRAARFGDEHGLSPAFLRRLFEQIVEETCRVETVVMAERGGEGVPGTPR